MTKQGEDTINERNIDLDKWLVVLQDMADKYVKLEISNTGCWELVTLLKELKSRLEKEE